MILLALTLSRLVVGQSIMMRRVVPILGVPDALVPFDRPVAQINLLPGYSAKYIIVLCKAAVSFLD